MGNNNSNQEKLKLCQEILVQIIEERELNLSSLSLKHVPPGLVNMIEIAVTKRRPNIQKLVIERVNMSDNGFLLFPFEAFFHLHKLHVLHVTEIDLSNAGIHSIVYICKPCDEEMISFDWDVVFPQLEKLLARGNQIQIFPNSFGNCKSLVNIDLGNNPCLDSKQFLPFVSDPNVCKISGLKVLKMGTCYNYLYSKGDISVPSSLLQLHQNTLQLLDLSDNHIGSFCKTIEDKFVMKNLIELLLHSNNITELNPLVFCGETFPSLRILALVSNQISELPEELCTISNLECLHLTRNKLKKLPDGIGNLSGLVYLDCIDNFLTELPESFSKLTKLTFLDLSNNKLTEISPDVLSNLVHLQDFYVTGNLLTNETCSLEKIGKCMGQICRISLAFNEFTSVDALFLKDNALSYLQYFGACGNQLTSLPPKLSTRPNLQTLLCGHNHLGELPPHFLKNLLAIRVLSLCGNKLTVNALPPNFFTAKNRQFRNDQLNTVDLSHNHIDFSNINFAAFFNEIQKYEQTIPLDIQSMYNTSVDKIPRIDNEERNNIGSVYSGAAHMRGSRVYMEDTFVIKNNVHTGIPNAHAQLYAVFDGHGGDSCANYCADNFASILSKEFEQNRDGYLHAENKATFEKSLLESAIKKLDGEVERLKIPDGCTAVFVLIMDHCRCIAANVGDARTVLAQEVENTIIGSRISLDHKPTSADERLRILNLGGTVADGRVKGYAVSRAIGDHSVRPFISAQPYITSIDLDVTRHKFIILGCDGVWDVVSDQRAAEVVNRTWNSVAEEPISNTAKLSRCSAALRDYAFALRSMDNITCIVLKINGLNVESLDPIPHERPVSIKSWIAQIGQHMAPPGHQEFAQLSILPI